MSDAAEHATGGPWPAEDDAESLEPVIERLKFEARRKVDERRSREED